VFVRVFVCVCVCVCVVLCVSEVSSMWAAAGGVQTRADRTADMVMHYS
jgi:hypothetical protein